MAMEHHGEESSPYFQRIRRETVSIAKVPDYYAKYVSDRRLFLELAIVFDLSMYEKYGRNKETLNDRATQVATLVNSSVFVKIIPSGLHANADLVLHACIGLLDVFTL
ncbi:hypothetical protein D918_06793 [Trichuris suis]|nr:hypothetical protein D918_06793 [Trichuris suis]